MINLRTLPHQFNILTNDCRNLLAIEVARTAKLHFLSLARKKKPLKTNNCASTKADEPGIIRSEFPPVPVQSVPIHETLQDAIWRHSLEQPGRAAFISAECPDEQITFAELLLQSHSVASFLDTVGFKHGDIAGVVVPNCWHFLAVYLGASMQGGCISGANALLTEMELSRQFTEAKCKVVFCADILLDKMRVVMQNCPHLKHVVLVPTQFPACPLTHLPSNILNWANIVQTRPNLQRPVPKIDVTRDLAYLPFSSGTTGPGKGVMLTHQNVGTMLNIFNTHYDERIARKMDPNWDWKKERGMLILPLYHIYGFILGLNSLMTGGTGILFKKFDLECFCKTIQQYKIKYAQLVPPLLVLLAKSGKVISRYDLSSLRFVMTGAAPVGDEICEELKKAIPSIEQVAQGYGMTEQSMASHLCVFGMDNQKAAGRLNANYEMKIVDVEKRTPLGFGQLGEICVRGPTIMLGYLNRPDATAETIDADGWLLTGDIGYQDEQGWTYVVDRLKELIKVKGLQVAPAELEDLLLAHLGIKDCAVIGIPDQLCGEVPKAFVVRADDKLSETEVKEFIKDKVAVYKQLRCVEFIDAIPKSPSGKILRRMLREKQIT